VQISEGVSVLTVAPKAFGSYYLLVMLCLSWQLPNGVVVVTLVAGIGNTLLSV
jgi:hypothetical protein